MRLILIDLMKEYGKNNRIITIDSSVSSVGSSSSLRSSVDLSVIDDEVNSVQTLALLFSFNA